MKDYNNGNEAENLMSTNYGVDVDTLKKLVNKYKQRENGHEDLDFFEEKGGERWLQKGLQTDFENGISESSIPMRENAFGHNKKDKVKVKGFFALCWEALDDLTLKILVVAGIASIIINVIVEEDHRELAWIEGFAILLAVLVVVVVTAYNDLKKEKEFQKLNEKAEDGKTVCLIRDGVQHDHIQVQNVVVGDILLVKGGIEVPGDGIVIKGNSITIDESSMTGETRHMKKESLNRCYNEQQKKLANGQTKFSSHDLPSPVIMAGTKVVSGTGKIILVNVGKNSAIGQIKELLTSGEEELTPLQLKLEKIARDIGLFGLISAILIFLVLVLRMIIEESIDGWEEKPMDYVRDVLEYFIIAIAILVVAIPEGLPLAVTLSLAFSVNKMMDDNNLVRKLQACETMGGANIICSDKTGTLTRNEMYLTNLWNGTERKIFDPKLDTPVPISEYTNDTSAQYLLNTVILNSVEDPKKKSGNPTEMAILKYFHLNDFDVVQYRNNFRNNIIAQAPFSSDRKRMSTIVNMNKNSDYVYMKGASEYMVDVSNSYHDLKTNQIIPINEEMREKLKQSIYNMANEALRTIGLCYKRIDLNNTDIENKDERGIFDYEKDGFTLIGICGIKDIIRSEVPKSMRQCHNAGIDVKMVTGDNKVTARAIAKEINLINPDNDKTALVMEGPEFLRLIEGVICDNCRDKEECDCVKNKYELEEEGNKGKLIRKDTIKNQKEFDKIYKNLKVLARSRPEDKYALVVGLKERDNVVAVTGDGTNDAPALKKANVGFAMNIAGTEVAKQAADILIMDDNFASIVQAVKWGRNIYDSIRKFLQFQLTVNVVAVITTFISAIILKEAIFSAVQMLWINLIMDTLAALALATEPPTEALLNRHPHSKNEYIVSPIMMKHIIGQSIFQSAIIFVLVFVGEKFLFDKMMGRQLQDGSDLLIVHGRKQDGFDMEDWDNQYSVHYTYNFNIFVWLQLFNLINSRVLDDSLNVFKNIHKSSYFVVIFIIIVILQIFFLTFLGRAIRVVKWGLDPLSWLFCIAIGSLGLIWGFILKFIPLEKILPGGGKEVIPINQLRKFSSMSLRKGHNKQFFEHQPGMIKRRTSNINKELGLN